MNTRTTSVTITFRSAFALPGWDETLPAGQYTVTTDEEQLDTSFPAFHRVATRIELRQGAVTQFLTISPQDLAAALTKDHQTVPRA
jgi:hypothetical protein